MRVQLIRVYEPIVIGSGLVRQLLRNDRDDNNLFVVFIYPFTILLARKHTFIAKQLTFNCTIDPLSACMRSLSTVQVLISKLFECYVLAV